MTSDSAEGNTYLLDAGNPSEVARLIDQDRIFTKAMGGPLAGLPDPSTFHTVLDLGCGPGGWVLDVAFAYPHLDVAGVDISQTMINYANARARSQYLTNASFGIMDITKPLDFADNSFSLVNARCLSASILNDAWPAFLAECYRILHPGGILRLTEMIDIGTTNSPSYGRIAALWYLASWQAGYSFSPGGQAMGLSHMLPSFLRTIKMQNIQYKPHALEISANAEAWPEFYYNVEVGGRQVRSFLAKTGLITQEDLELLYQQAIIEILSDDFCGIWHLMSTWGNKPIDE